MQIKTIARNISRTRVSLRNVTIAHAARIILTEVMQAGGRFVGFCFVDKGPKYFRFAVDNTEYVIKCSKEERAAFMPFINRMMTTRNYEQVGFWSIGNCHCDECRLIGKPRFDANSMKAWMMLLLDDAVWGEVYEKCVKDQPLGGLTQLADEIDRKIAARVPFNPAARAA